jgi:hypothetical protein
MTIGIAAFGPNAGRAVWQGLRAVAQVGRGAIGGYASCVAIRADGEVLRAETQRGGASALLDAHGALPEELAAAPFAGVMSSGPDRPEPLSQFTPADGAVGLVTGHRMPNDRGASGMRLNDEVLVLMRAGLDPEAAIGRVVAANPDADAGLVALDRQGRLGAADTPHVMKRGDRGMARLVSPCGRAGVAVLHNAILPHRPLAALAAEVALDVMLPPDRVDGWITVEAGTPLGRAEGASWLAVDAADRVTGILLDRPRLLRGTWSLGIGHEPELRRDGRCVGVVLYEPYMVIEDGVLRSADGRPSLRLPVRYAGVR